MEIGACSLEEPQPKFSQATIMSPSFTSLAKSGSALGYAAKGVNWASKHINPLICVSGAVKVAMADDKKSEAINQSSALTGMFAVEKATKLLQTTQGRAKLAKMGIGQNKFIQKLMKAMNYIDKVAQNSHSKWGRIGIPCLKGIGFVCMSIAGYSMGSYLGEKINEMRKDKTPIEYAA